MDLRRQYEYVRHLNKPIKEVLSDYTDNLFENLNFKLRRGEQLNEIQNEIVELIDGAFEGAPAIEDPIIVYRGIYDTENVSTEVLSYISTSLDELEAKKFADTSCCLLRITVSSGSKILPLEEISRIPREKEILLPRTGQIIITNQHQDNELKIYDLTYLPDNSLEINEEIPNLVIEERFDSEEWVDRIVKIITPETAELFNSIEALVDFVVKYSGGNAPSEAVARVINILKNDSRYAFLTTGN